jgi:hypothetical protein
LDDDHGDRPLEREKDRVHGDAGLSKAPFIDAPRFSAGSCRAMTAFSYRERRTNPA